MYSIEFYNFQTHFKKQNSIYIFFLNFFFEKGQKHIIYINLKKSS